MDTLLAGNLNLTNFRKARTGIVARAGGNQATSTQLADLVNRVDTVATIADAVCLPPSQHGLRIVVVNNAALSMNVFPYAGDQINALAPNAAYAQAAAKTVEFVCAQGGQSEGNANGFWYSIPA